VEPEAGAVPAADATVEAEPEPGTEGEEPVQQAPETAAVEPPTEQAEPSTEAASQPSGTGADGRAANDPRNRAAQAARSVPIEDVPPQREKPAAQTAEPIPVAPPRRDPQTRAANDPRARRRGSEDDQVAGGSG
jgi:hypothetical protein